MKDDVGRQQWLVQELHPMQASHVEVVIDLSAISHRAACLILDHELGKQNHVVFGDLVENHVGVLGHVALGHRQHLIAPLAEKVHHEAV